MTKPLLLQMNPLSPWLEGELARSFEIGRLFEVADRDVWLDERGDEVVAIAAGGDFGAPTSIVERLPRLGIVAINGVGTDKVDLAFMRARGIRVSTTPGVLTDDVADLAVGLVISLLRGICPSDRFVREGRWTTGNRPLARKVSGRTFGIVGHGFIGAAIAERLVAFGPVLYTDIEDKRSPHRFVSELVELASAVDVLILSSSANAATRHLVGGAVLDALGPEGYLVNVARGSLVDEAALVAALADGRIAGAALDVFEDEPNVPSALIDMPNVVLTPHIASATAETRHRMAEMVAANLLAFLAGAEPPTAIA